MGYLDISKPTISAWDRILIIGLILSPMTGFRIWKIGPAELLCFIWCLGTNRLRYVKNNFVFRFFLFFLLCMLIGSFFGCFMAPDQLSISGGLTWIYLAFIATGIYSGLQKNSLEYNTVLMESFSYGALGWYSLLLIYGKHVGRNFLGAPLWFYQRYTGGGTNPHQVAVLCCGVVFILFRNILNREKIIISLIFVALGINIILATDSSTAIVALFFGAATALYIFIATFVHDRKRKRVLYICESLALISLVILKYDYFYEAAFEWISSDSNGLGRLVIFSRIINVLKISPLFGLGPGVHAVSERSILEFHNTYLEIIAACGIIGFFVFIRFTIQIIKKMKNDLTFLPVLTAIYAYGLAGFALRRLAYWGVLIFAIILSEQKEYSE